MLRICCFLALLAATSTSCGVTTQGESSDLQTENINPDGWERFSAVRDIPIRFAGSESTVSFYDYSRRSHTFHVYKTFQLYDNAKVTFTTKYHETRVASWNEMNRGIDTKLYLFQESGDREVWGESFAADDDSGEDKFSQISRELPPGAYRFLISRRWDPRDFPENYTPIVRLQSECEGDGCQPPPEPARICLYDSNWDCVFGEAITLLGEGVDLRVAEAVALQQVPEAARSAVAAAVTEIEEREFSGTDYQAWLDSIYAIYRSENDHTVLGYAVVGYGTGEPDYNDGVVYGFDVNGNAVFSDQEDW